MKSKIFKIIAFLQIAFLIIPSFALPARAETISNVWSFVDPISSAITKSAISVTQDVLQELLDEAGIGYDAFEGIGEAANVMENKRNGVEVQLMFSPQSPKVAEEITATALPKYFQQDKSNLYFTWYLKHAECKEAKKGSKKYVKSCDLNNDDEVNIEDYKIEAMRIVASGNFNKKKADYITGPEEDSDDDGFSTIKEYAQNGIVTEEVCKGFSKYIKGECKEGTETQEDIDDVCDKAGDHPNPVCTKTSFGGTNVKTPTDGFRCYVKDHASGVLYEIVEESTEPEGGGLSGCTVTVDGEIGTETSVTEDGRSVFRFSKKGGDYSANPTVEISNCENGADDYSESFPNPGNASDCNSNPGDSGRYTLGDGSLWKGNSESDCNLAMILAGSYGTEISTDTPSICTHLFPNATDNEGKPKFTTGDGSFTTEEEKFWGTNPKDPDTDGDGTGDEADVAGVAQNKLTWTYNKGDMVGVAVEGNSTNTTKHADSSYMVMWALPKNNFDTGGDCKIKSKGSYTKTINDRDVEIETAQTNINECLTENLVDPREDPTGEGYSGNIDVDLIYSPKKPHNDSSADGGFYKYAIDNSKGKSTFTLCPGSPEMDSCKEIGIPNGELNNMSKESPSCGRQVFSGELVSGGSHNIECVSKEGDDYKFLISDGSQSQEGNCRDAIEDKTCDPKASTSGNRGSGSYVTIQSILNNSESNDSREVYYNWSVWGRNDEDFMKDNWTNITSNLDIGTTQGLNKDSINFKLNLKEGSDAYKAIFGDDDSQGYIKAKLEVEENYDSGMTKSGSKEKIIKVTTGARNKINFYRAKYDNDELTIDRDSQLCVSQEGNQNINDPVCAISENEIVAAELQTDNNDIGNYAWTLNGEALECTSKISSLCSDNKQGDIIFFPVLGRSKDKYTLSLVANDVDPTTSSKDKNKGESLELNQIFKVIDPQIKIGPFAGYDKNTCKNSSSGFQPRVMGHYDDVDDDVPFSVASCSTKIFESTGGELKIQVDFLPSFIGKHLREVYAEKKSDKERDNVITVSIEGKKQDISFEDDGKIVIKYDASDAKVGDSINVNVSGTYAQSEAILEALIDKWKISQFEMSDKKISGSINIKIVEKLGTETSLNKVTNITASLVTNLPAQLLFLFRMILTIGAVIFISGTVFALGKQGT